ncbi:DoxX family protein [Actinacidiphila sp. bgisy160]|uniref:DoxX family protein n=1 Tax=Actinacidiphila sp. bgisy160 TaxID=3413796 RepID=UPI003D761BCC
MSVDTRTPRTPPGGRSSAITDEPVLNMLKVSSDPAQVIVNHASFRVQLGATSGRALTRTQRVPVIPTSVRPSAAAQRRGAPLVWSGRSEPGDAAATHLLAAVRHGQADGLDLGAATQVLPRIEEPPQPVVGPPRRPPAPGEMLGGIRPARGAYGGYDPEDTNEFAYSAPPADPVDEGPDFDPYEEPGEGYGRARDRERAEPIRHAYYPGRRMNLGIVLLPLRIFLGFISIYAGMGKLCDPVYFDGGKRGSMVTWLASLHPSGLAEPLRDLALAHPIGAGLTVAFLQVIAGVLTVFGLWQRLAASIGVMLSAALLVTVSWRTVPAYDTPDIILLAAWSPLVIAGAPVYSADGRLAGEAWRKLGPRAPLGELRRRVLRRGAVLATVLTGISLVVGATLGTAVRSTSPRSELPAPTDLPTNDLEGSPLPEVPGEKSSRPSRTPSAGRSGGPSPSPSSAPSAPGPASSAPNARQSRPGASSGNTGNGGGTGGGPTQPVPSVPSRPTVPNNPPTPGGGSGGGGSGGGSSDSGGALGGLLGSGETSGWLLGAPARHGSGKFA